MAASFSIIFGRPIHVTNVRAGRKVPGLRPQHASTLKILRDVCSGSMEGGEIGSTEFTFSPGKPTSKSISIEMGTAASITLVLQALVPAVSLSRVSLDIELNGGTDVPWSPTSDYFGTVVAPSFRALGIDFTLDVSRRGYYPIGGGRARVRISPCDEVRPLDLSRRTVEPPVSIISRAGMLSKRVAERQAEAATSMLARHGLTPGEVAVFSDESLSPGTSILVSSVSNSSFIGSDAIGARGRPAERVGMDAAGHFVRTFQTGACVDPNLVDMIAPLLCLAKRPSVLLTSNISGHLKTGLNVAQRFVEARYTTEERGEAVLLTIDPAPAK